MCLEGAGLECRPDTGCPDQLSLWLRANYDRSYWQRHTWTDLLSRSLNKRTDGDCVCVRELKKMMKKEKAKKKKKRWRWGRRRTRRGIIIRRRVFHTWRGHVKQMTVCKDHHGDASWQIHVPSFLPHMLRIPAASRDFSIVGTGTCTSPAQGMLTAVGRKSGPRLMSVWD